MIQKQKITLFMHSSLYHDSQIVKYFVQENGLYKLNTALFNSLSYNEQEFLKKLFSEQFENISSEWEIKKIQISERDKNIKCDLCNQPNLKIIATIENKINKKQLIVGSSCIQSYNKITSKDGKSIKESVQNFIRIKNIEYIENNIDSFYQDYLALKHFLKTVYIIKKTILRDIKKSVKTIDTLLGKQNLEKHIVIESIKKIKNTKLEMDEWLKFSEEDFLGINKEIQKWISLYGSEVLATQLSKFGQITSETFLDIKEINFIKRAIELIRIYLFTEGISIEEIKNSNFVIKLRNSNVKYQVNYEKLAASYINEFMLQYPFKISIKYMFMISELVLDNQNIRFFLDALFYSATTIQYKYFLNKYSYVGIIRIRKDNDYLLENIYVLPVYSVISRFKDTLVYGILTEEVVQYFINLSHVIKFTKFTDFKGEVNQSGNEGAEIGTHLKKEKEEE